MAATSGGTRRGWSRSLGWLLAAGLLVASLGPAARAPAADAQNLTPDDAAWVEQRLLEAAVYLGGGLETPTLEPADFPQFGELYRNCLTLGLLQGSSRSTTLDACAEVLLSPLVEPQDWISDVDAVAQAFLDELTAEGVEPNFAGVTAADMRDCMSGLARTRFLDVDTAQAACEEDSRAGLAEALAPPPPSPTPVPTLAPSTPTPLPAPPTVAPAPTGAGVIYYADESSISGDNAHLTWINAGPIDTRLAAGSAEMRLDPTSGRMVAPALLSLTLQNDAGTDVPVCTTVRLNLQGMAPPVEGSAAEGDGLVLNYDGTLVRSFEGQNCPPEREFRSEGSITSLRAVLVADPDRNENVIALCSLALVSTSRDDCRNAAIAILRPLRPPS